MSLFCHGEDVRNKAGKHKDTSPGIALGVDVRGDGGYCIAWFLHGCELVAKGAPADWPAWLLRLVLGSSPVPSQYQGMPLSNADRYARAALLSAKERVACAPEGSRNHTLNVEAFSLGRLISEGKLSRSEIELHLREAALAAGLSALEADATILS